MNKGRLHEHYEHFLCIMCDALLWSLRTIEKVRIPGTKGHKI